MHDHLFANNNCNKKTKNHHQSTIFYTLTNQETEQDRRTEEMEEKMEGELRSLVQVTISATAAFSYCYFLVPKLLGPGKLRLLSLLPVFYLFTQLPFLFSTIHLRGISGFFLAWLAIFKLLLFSFSQGPLSDPGLSFPLFLALSSLPIKLQLDNPKQPQPKKPNHINPLLGFALKGILFALLISHYQKRHEYHRAFVLALYALHLYLALDLVLASIAVVCRIFLAGRKIEFEPQFSAPYLSTSLQDFWGRRWNLMVTRILHPTVYVPVRSISDTYTAAVAVFLVSGLMHELMFYYLTLERPTGEVTGFFVLQGACVAMEVAAKRALGGKGCRPLPTVVAAPLTVGFVWVTGLWLFFPPVLRGGTEEGVIGECTAVLEVGRSAVVGLFV